MLSGDRSEAGGREESFVKRVGQLQHGILSVIDLTLALNVDAIVTRVIASAAQRTIE
jgi:hypothetical protein